MIIISYYEDKDGHRSYDGWSEKFSISKVNDFAINIKKKKYEKEEDDKED